METFVERLGDGERVGAERFAGGRSFVEAVVARLAGERADGEPIFVEIGFATLDISAEAEGSMFGLTAGVNLTGTFLTGERVSLFDFAWLMHAHTVSCRSSRW